jgi:hypothetical protein
MNRRNLKFITLNTHYKPLERLLAMGTPDSLVRHRTGTVRCAVRCHVSRPLGFGASRPFEALSSCGTGHSGAPWLPAVTLFICESRPLRAENRCSAGSSDSLVAHRTVQWIIVERAFVFSRVAGWHMYSPGAPDTVRWHTRQSGAPILSTPKFFALFQIESLTWISYWFVLNLMHL